MKLLLQHTLNRALTGSIGSQEALESILQANLQLTGKPLTGGDLEALGVGLRKLLTGEYMSFSVYLGDGGYSRLVINRIGEFEVEVFLSSVSLEVVKKRWAELNPTC